MRHNVSVSSLRFGSVSRSFDLIIGENRRGHYCVAGLLYTLLAAVLNHRINSPNAFIHQHLFDVFQIFEWMVTPAIFHIENV